MLSLAGFGSALGWTQDEPLQLPGVGDAVEHQPGAGDPELLAGVRSRRYRDRPHADRSRAADVVRRVADDDHLLARCSVDERGRELERSLRDLDALGVALAEA